MLEKTHDYIAKKSLKLFPRFLLMKRKRGVLKLDKNMVKETWKYRKYILKGVRGADWPSIRIFGLDIGVSAARHYFNPFSKKGYSVFRSARDNAKVKFEEAISLYRKGKKEAAFYRIGEVLHHIADMAVPAHTHVSSHPLDSDDLEQYLEKNIDAVKKEIKLEDIRPAIKKKLDVFFHKLARKSYHQGIYGNSFWKAFKYKFFDKKKTLSPEELKSQAKRMVPEAIKHSMGIMVLFYKKLGMAVHEQGKKYSKKRKITEIRPS